MPLRLPGLPDGRAVVRALMLAVLLPACGGSPVSGEDDRLRLRDASRLTDDTVEQFLPAVSEGRVVWEREAPGGGRRVIVLELATGERHGVSAAASSQRVPALDGSIAVWMDDRAGNWDIFARDLGTGEEVRVTRHPAHQLRPSVSGRRVVWTDARNGNPDVFAAELGTDPAPKPVAVAPLGQQAAVLSGSLATWEEGRRGRAQIMLGDLDSGEQRLLPPVTGVPVRPVIAGRRVAWQEDIGGQWEIVLRDLDADTARLVTDHPGRQFRAALSRELLAWQDDRDGTEGVVVMDLATGETLTVDVGPPGRTAPAVSGRRLAWTAGDPDGEVWTAVVERH